jgi:hypothetical protein
MSTTTGDPSSSPAQTIDPMDVERFLSSNMEFFKDWVMKNIGRNMLESWASEKQMAIKAAQVLPSYGSMQSDGPIAGTEMTISVQRDTTAGKSATTDLFEQVMTKIVKI